MKKLVKRVAATDGGTGAASFLKLVDGQSVTGVFRGELMEFWQKWPKGGAKELFYEPTTGASSRFRLNFVFKEDGKAIAKIFEFGTVVYNMLAELQENFDLEKTTIKITRRGSDKNTQWMLIPLGPIDPKGIKAIEAVDLVPLGPQENSAPATIPDEVPF